MENSLKHLKIAKLFSNRKQIIRVKNQNGATIQYDTPENKMRKKQQKTHRRIQKGYKKYIKYSNPRIPNKQLLNDGH